MTSWLNNNFKLLALTLLAVLSSSVWGEDVIYTCGFEDTESFEASSDYTGTMTGGVTDKQWTIFRGAWTSASSKITGNQSAALRMYSSSGNDGYLKTNFTLQNLTYFTFKAKATTSNSSKFKIDVQYSTDGANWNSMYQESTCKNAWSAQTPSTSATTYSAYMPTAQRGTLNVYIRIAVNSSSIYPSKSNTQLTIDDIEAYGAAASKTLSSIAVKTAPTKVTYTEGDKFDPTGLVITKTYDDSSTEDLAYAGHESDFTFSPSTSTALTTSNTSVTITVGGKSTTQTITVNAKSKYTVTFYNAGVVVKTVSDITEGTLFSAIKPTIGTGSGQLNIESCDNSSTHFMGWTTDEAFQKRKTEPSYVADNDAINDNMELRAVWAKEDE